MRKVLTAAIAAVTAVGAVLATAAPAQAERYRHSYHRGGHHHGGNNDEVAAAIIGGVAGLALGAAIAGNNNQRTRASSSHYDNGYAYDPRYDSYSGGYRYSEPRYTSRTCISRERVYDPYLDRPVTIERRYAC